MEYDRLTLSIVWHHNSRSVRSEQNSGQLRNKQICAHMALAIAGHRNVAAGVKFTNSPSVRSACFPL